MMKRALTSLASLARTIRGDGRLLLGFLALAILGFVFLKFASEVFEGETFAIDRTIMLALRQAADLSVPAGPAWVLPVMQDITAMGGGIGLTLITIVITGFLIAARKYATAGFVAASITGGAILSFALKAVFVRARPDVVPHLVMVDTSSFPSGHAMNSAIVFLTLGALLTRTQKDRRVRVYLIAVSIILTLLVGFSRVYLGVHWPSDVFAGWVVGAAWATLCLTAARLLQENRQIEAPEEQA